MALLLRVSPGDRTTRIDCCSGCEAGIRPPADVSECLETVCSQSLPSVFCFLRDISLGNRENPLSSLNYTVSGNFIRKAVFFQRTLVAAVVAPVLILKYVNFWYDSRVLTLSSWMRRLQDELVQLVGVVFPHLAHTLWIVLLLFRLS